MIESLAGQAEAVEVVAFVAAEGVLRDRMARVCAAAGVATGRRGAGQTDAAARLVLERADSLTG